MVLRVILSLYNEYGFKLPLIYDVFKEKLIETNNAYEYNKSKIVSFCNQSVKWG